MLLIELNKKKDFGMNFTNRLNNNFNNIYNIYILKKLHNKYIFFIFL